MSATGSVRDAEHFRNVVNREQIKVVCHRSSAAIALNALRRRRPVAEEQVTPRRMPLHRPAVAPPPPDHLLLGLRLARQ
ncbi:hypothetical protein J6590_000427 [Homalodisca vitripennis]|nr:hypothetical protein J6590_000427 [Homalodisca vitripennis]